MAKLKDLIKEYATMGGVVSRPAFSNLDMGFRTQKTPKDTDLSGMVEDIYGQSTQRINVNEFLKEVSGFNSFGKQIYREGNLKDLAERLSRLAVTAKQHTIQETENWFDKITVNRNMKELTGLSGQFGKIANEAKSLQERMGALYEDMGNILGRYYEIGETHKNGEHEPMTGDKDEYQKFFRAALKKYGVSEPDKLPDDKKKEFYNYVDANWSGDNESD